MSLSVYMNKLKDVIKILNFLVLMMDPSEFTQENMKNYKKRRFPSIKIEEVLIWYVQDVTRSKLQNSFKNQCNTVKL